MMFIHARLGKDFSVFVTLFESSRAGLCFLPRSKISCVFETCHEVNAKLRL